MNQQLARSNMIEQQVRPWDVLDQRVLDVLAAVPREEFVASEHRGLAFSDYQLPIGFGQTLFKPNLDGRILQTLSIELTDCILEIGTGSGYLTACLARLGNHCESVDIHPQLAASAAARLNQLGVSNISLHQQDAAQSWDARDQYDVIVFGGSIEVIPPYYNGKLSKGGRLFAVIGNSLISTMEAVLVTRVTETEWTTESLFETRIDPLVNFETTQPDFEF